MMGSIDIMNICILIVSMLHGSFVEGIILGIVVVGIVRIIEGVKSRK